MSPKSIFAINNIISSTCFTAQYFWDLKYLTETANLYLSIYTKCPINPIQDGGGGGEVEVEGRPKRLLLPVFHL